MNLRLTVLRLACLVIIGGLMALTPRVGAATPAFTWIEGETPTASTIKVAADVSAHPEWLSGGKWLLVAIDGPEVDKALPGENLDLTYACTIANTGKKDIWARLGFESARTNFDWRIDEQPWQHIDSHNLSTDLMELSPFCEVMWLRLGDSEIATGEHRFEIRVPKTKNAKGQTQRLLFGLDAVCISDGPVHPFSKFKPGEDPRTEADRAAEKQVFSLPAAPAGGRARCDFAGWDVVDLPG